MIRPYHLKNIGYWQSVPGGMSAPITPANHIWQWKGGEHVKTIYFVAIMRFLNSYKKCMPIDGLDNDLCYNSWELCKNSYGSCRIECGNPNRDMNFILCGEIEQVTQRWTVLFLPGSWHFVNLIYGDVFVHEHRSMHTTHCHTHHTSGDIIIQPTIQWQHVTETCFCEDILNSIKGRPLANGYVVKFPDSCYFCRHRFRNIIMFEI